MNNSRRVRIKSAVLTAFFFAVAICGCAQTRRAIVDILPLTKSSATYRIFDDFAAVAVRPGDSFESLAEKFLDDASKGWVIREFNGIDKLHPNQKLIIPFDITMPAKVRNGKYQTIPVLTYHKFSQRVVDAMTVRVGDFEAQMNYLKNNGYHIITLKQLIRYMQGTTRIPEKSVVITVDDGWRSFYQFGYPILKKHEFPATLFVYTELISGSSQTLDWKLIAEMARNGIDIQCHSKTHRNFNTRYPNESLNEYFHSIRSEIEDSAQIINSRLGTKVQFFAYPYGEENSLAVAVLEKNGFKGAFTVERKSAPFFSDPYKIGRRMIYGGFNLNWFKKNLEVYDDEALR